MYIFESLLHFGSILIPLGIWGIIILLSVIEIIKRTHRSRLPGFLFLLNASWFFMVLLIFTLSLILLPANATVQQLLPYYQWCGVFFGLFFVFNMYYLGFMTKWDILNGIQWPHVLALVVIIPFLYLITLLSDSSAIGLVSDGILNYLALPIPIVVYGILLLITCIILGTYKIFGTSAGQREKYEQFWLRMYWFFGQLSSVILILAILVEYTVSIMPLLFVINPIGTIVGIYSMVKYETAYGKRMDESSASSPSAE